MKSKAQATNEFWNLESAACASSSFARMAGSYKCLMETDLPAAATAAAATAAGESSATAAR